MAGVLMGRVHVAILNGKTRIVAQRDTMAEMLSGGSWCGFGVVAMGCMFERRRSLNIDAE